MLHNTDITIYSKGFDSKTRMDIWTRMYVPDAWWYRGAKSSIVADGLKTADTVAIRIPDTGVSIKKEDYVVKGKCNLNILSPTELMKLDCCKVTAVNYNTFGGNQHIKVGGV